MAMTHELKTWSVVYGQVPPTASLRWPLVFCIPWA